MFMPSTLPYHQVMGTRLRFTQFYQFVLSATVLTAVISATLFIFWNLYQLVTLALVCLVGFTLPIYFLYKNKYCYFSVSYLAVVCIGLLVASTMIPFTVLAPFWITVLVLAFALFPPEQKFIQMCTVTLIGIACVVALMAYNIMGIGVDLGENSPLFSAILFILSAIITVGSIQFYVSQLTNERLNRQLFAQLLREKQAQFEFKSRFISTMSHEIRTPLASIFGVMQIVENMPLEVKTKSYIKEANKAINHVQTLLDDVLDYARLEANQLTLHEKPFTINEIIDTLQDHFQSQAFQKGLQFSLNCNVDPNLQLIGDAQRIHKVILVLLSNAVKFTNFGAITLTISGKEQEDISISGEQRYYLHIEVLDTGIGMTKLEIENLFKPFSQIQQDNIEHSGVGLSLCISQAILKNMQTKLNVASIKDAGSKFYFTLNLALHNSAAQQASPRSNENGFINQNYTPYTQGICCLVVDDNRLNLTVTKAMLENLNMHAIEAESGEKAIKILQKQEQPIHLILMDMQMPGLNGAETTRFIRNQLGMKHIPILALTADVDLATASQCKQAGMNDVLTKPIGITHLRESVYQQLKNTA